jgi:hypothetical protein
MEDALILRARALAAQNRRMIEEDWKREVDSQGESARSWLRRTYASIQKRSRLRGWASCLTIEELANVLMQSGGRCALTGIKLVIDAKKRDPFAISVDRIDSTLGYCYGNVRLVSLAVNLAMSHWGEDALLTISKALVGRELLKTLNVGGYMDIRTGGSEK